MNILNKVVNVLAVNVIGVANDSKHLEWSNGVEIRHSENKFKGFDSSKPLVRWRVETSRIVSEADFNTTLPVVYVNKAFRVGKHMELMWKYTLAIKAGTVSKCVQDVSPAPQFLKGAASC